MKTLVASLHLFILLSCSDDEVVVLGYESVGFVNISKKEMTVIDIDEGAYALINRSIYKFENKSDKSILSELNRKNGEFEIKFHYDPVSLLLIPNDGSTYYGYFGLALSKDKISKIYSVPFNETIEYLSDGKYGILYATNSPRLIAEYNKRDSIRIIDPFKKRTIRTVSITHRADLIWRLYLSNDRIIAVYEDLKSDVYIEQLYPHNRMLVDEDIISGEVIFDESTDSFFYWTSTKSTESAMAYLSIIQYHSLTNTSNIIHKFTNEYSSIVNFAIHNQKLVATCENFVEDSNPKLFIFDIHSNEVDSIDLVFRGIRSIQ